MDFLGNMQNEMRLGFMRVDEQLSLLKQGMDQKFGEVDGQFGEVRGHLVGIDQHFVEVDEHFVKIDSRMDYAIQKIDLTFDEVGHMKEQLTAIERTVIRLARSSDYAMAKIADHDRELFLLKNN